MNFIILFYWKILRKILKKEKTDLLWLLSLSGWYENFIQNSLKLYSNPSLKFYSFYTFSLCQYATDSQADWFTKIKPPHWLLHSVYSLLVVVILIAVEHQFSNSTILAPKMLILDLSLPCGLFRLNIPIVALPF